MRILLDTNILIAREDHKAIAHEIIEFQKIIHKYNLRVCIHQLSTEDISRDKNPERKTIIQKKISSYHQLEDPPDYLTDQDFMNLIGPTDNINNIIDNQLLYALYKDTVDFLITQDVNLRKKAARFQLNERVFSINEINVYLINLYGEPSIKTPVEIKEVPFHNINVNDNFFDDLRRDYAGFNKWFVRKSKDGSKAWTYHHENKTLGAFCAWKEETEEIASTPPLSKKRRLKICTLKVEHKGYKIGELFLKMSFDYAIKKGIDEIYLTHYDVDNDRLIELIEEFGFTKKADRQGESIYTKNLIPGSNQEVQQIKQFYPSIRCGPEIRKFFIPIIPKYHSRLFPEYEILCEENDAQGKLFDRGIQMKTEGNTIKKAYISHSNTSKIQIGSILLFYRSRDRREITSIGVVDQVHTKQSNPDLIMKLISKRTVYNFDEIQNWAKKPLLVLVFRWHFYFNTPISHKNLMGHNIFLAIPQSITEIEHSNFQKIIELGGINERYLFD